ncbi:MAG: hypothetical protein E6710_13175 [Acinetobacter baumannii]|uniref:hypothetical protein n=1 Tax=Acinetobacter baumannii TaxID=470 RepID=UPI002160EEDE|nr:hypothetical protein [Acinetobacter baumannii]MDU3123278.1 hypothetical protein [Acinetobacter baumannii]
MEMLDRTKSLLDAYPKIDSGNRILDIYLVQREICQNALDGILKFWQSEDNKVHDHLVNLFFQEQLNSISKNNTLPSELSDLFKLSPSLKESLDFLMKKAPIELPERFFYSLSQLYVSADAIAIDLNDLIEQEHEDIDKILIERLTTDTPFFTQLALLIGGLRKEFLTRFELLSKEEQENIQKKGEPYRVCRRVNILRDYPDDKTKLYPRN